jgi:hypothetical protein
VPGCEEGCLVDQIGQVGSSEAGCAPGEGLYGNVGAKGFASRVDAQDLLPTQGGLAYQPLSDGRISLA